MLASLQAWHFHSAYRGIITVGIRLNNNGNTFLACKGHLILNLPASRNNSREEFVTSE